MSAMGVVIVFLLVLFAGIAGLAYVSYRIMSWFLIGIGKRALKEMNEEKGKV
jgi:hypothetical protein